VLFIEVFYLGAGVLAQESFVSIFAVTIHLIFTIVCFVALFATRNVGSGQIEENAGSFGKGFIVSLTPLFIILAWNVPFMDPVTFGLMALYFMNGAFIEELTFRYALPRLLWSYGYGYWRSLITSNFAFSIVHWFAWEMSPSTLLIGIGYGMANGLALSVGASFISVSVSHGIYNMSLMGVPGLYLLLLAGVIWLLVAIRSWKR
jgi:hypothetical protein